MLVFICCCCCSFLFCSPPCRGGAGAQKACNIKRPGTAPVRHCPCAFFLWLLLCPAGFCPWKCSKQCPGRCCLLTCCCCKAPLLPSHFPSDRCKLQPRHFYLAANPAKPSPLQPPAAAPSLVPQFSPLTTLQWHDTDKQLDTLFARRATGPLCSKATATRATRQGELLFDTRRSTSADRHTCTCRSARENKGAFWATCNPNSNSTSRTSNQKNKTARPPVRSLLDQPIQRQLPI